VSETKYQLPDFLTGKCEPARYARWLQRKARAHAKRDRERFDKDICTVSTYKEQIHAAVVAGGDRDFYTGESLDWDLISKFENAAAKLGRTEYKKAFWRLPTIDHTFDEQGRRKFVICSWKTNDAKNDLLLEEFHALCDAVRNYRDSRIETLTATTLDREVRMTNTIKREFVARTKYHHSKRTSEQVTLLAFKDSNDAYELVDDRETESESVAGSKKYVLDEWIKRNRDLIEGGFQRDNMSGDHEWQRFIS
jgi:hypothetical protein